MSMDSLKGVIDTLLDHIEVNGTDQKNEITAKVYLTSHARGARIFDPADKRKHFCLYQTMHMIRADIETEVSPIVGSEKQSEEMIHYLLQEFEGDTAKIWQSNIFGKSFHELVGEDLNAKVKRMPEDAREKLRETLQRIINEGSGGLICIIL